MLVGYYVYLLSLIHTTKLCQIGITFRCCAVHEWAGRLARTSLMAQVQLQPSFPFLDLTKRSVIMHNHAWDPR
jgi:hypothetical protein